MSPTEPHAPQVVRVAGVPLAVSVRAAGTGAPLLLLRGLGGASDRWDGLHPHLAGRETISVDVPGMGGSPPPPLRPRRMGWYADLVAGAVRRLGHDRVDVLGVSWGGALAQEVVHRHPDLVRRLVLVATSAGLAAVPSVVGLADATTRGFLREVGGRLRRTGQGDPRGTVTRVGFAGQVLAMTGWTSIRWLGSVRTPALVLAGTRDRVIPAANARILAARLPDARLHLVADAGHDVLSSHPHEAFGAICTFLDRPGAARA